MNSPYIVSTPVNDEILRLKQEIATLTIDAQSGFLAPKVSSNLAAKKQRLAQLTDPNSASAQGITPAPAAAPIFAGQIDIARIGVSDLKVLR